MTTAVEASLNQGQQKAAEGFIQFLFSSDKELIISGGGGVGKTHLMGYLIDSVMVTYFDTCKIMGIEPLYNEVIMTATTNKAAEVLGIATKRPTMTIHSFLNLKVMDNHDTGKSKLTQTRSWKIHENMIIFIDECSMIDSALHRFIREGTHNCKIVYVGDHCQLPPVTETISPIYRNNLPFYELTQSMRNAGQPALMTVCAQLRDTVETGIFKPIQIVPGIIDHVGDDEMQQLVYDHFQHQTRSARILTYTNQKSILYNEFVRDIRQLPYEYGVGELLINNQPIQLRDRQGLSVEAEVEIIGQDEQTELMTIEPGVKLEVRNSVIRTGIGQVFTEVPMVVDRAHYLSLVKFYQRQKNWNRYFYLKNTFPDLRPRDASTGHKSQGSTYDIAFIDVGDLSTCRQPDIAARLLYVCFSRASSRVILYGDLDSKYGGLQH